MINSLASSNRPIHPIHVFQEELKNGGYEKYLHFSDWLHFFSASKELYQWVISQHSFRLIRWIECYEQKEPKLRSKEPSLFLDGILGDLEIISEKKPDRFRTNLSFLLFSHLLFKEYRTFFPSHIQAHFPDLENSDLPQLKFSYNFRLHKILLQIYEAIKLPLSGSFSQVPTFLVLLDWIDKIETKAGKYSYRTREISSSLIHNIYTVSYLVNLSLENEALYQHCLNLIVRTSIESTQRFVSYCEQEKKTLQRISKRNLSDETFNSSASKTAQRAPTPLPPFLITPDFERKTNQQNSYRISYLNSNGEITKQQEFHLVCYKPPSYPF